MPACLTTGLCSDIDVPDSVEAVWPAELCRTTHTCRTNPCCGDVQFSVARGCQGSSSLRHRTGLHTRHGQTDANWASQITRCPDGRLPCRCAKVTGRERSLWLVTAVTTFLCGRSPADGHRSRPTVLLPLILAGHTFLLSCRGLSRGRCRHDERRSWRADFGHTARTRWQYDCRVRSHRQVRWSYQQWRMVSQAGWLGQVGLTAGWWRSPWLLLTACGRRQWWWMQNGGQPASYWATRTQCVFLHQLELLWRTPSASTAAHNDYW